MLASQMAGCCYFVDVVVVAMLLLHDSGDLDLDAALKLNELDTDYSRSLMEFSIH